MIVVSGVSESRVSLPASVYTGQKKQNLIIVPTSVRAKRLAQDLEFFQRDKEILVLPDESHFFLGFDARNHDSLIERLKALKALTSGAPVTVIAPVCAALRHLTPHEYFTDSRIEIAVGDEVELEELKQKLVGLGYERMRVVDDKGQFAVRGGIIDCFTPDSDFAYRIELFGTTVDSIRTFDCIDQRSVENLNECSIYPAEQILVSEEVFKTASAKIRHDYDKAASKALREGKEELASDIRSNADRLIEYINEAENIQLLENYLHYFYDHTDYIWDYMEDGNILIDDPDRIYEQIELMEHEMSSDFSVMLERGQVIPGDEVSLITEKDFQKAVHYRDVVIFTPFPKKIRGVETMDKLYNLNTRQPLVFNGKMNVLEQELKAYLKRGYNVNIVCSTDERLNNLREFTERCEMEGRLRFLKGSLTSGLDMVDEKTLYLTENEIFATPKKSRRKKFNSGDRIASFTDLHEGDFVVHENHGIGKFIGIVQMTVDGNKKDYIKIKYAGSDLLYVAVEQMDVVQKFVGGDGTVPKINKLSGGEWKATKAKAKSEIAVMAKDLIDLYARRTMRPGHAFQKDTEWQREFEEAFPYEETGDQLRAVDEIKADMEKPFAMDRLLLGDVGFGKTEVAARAIFKCLAEGKQAAFLVPTTILANQHYYTLRDRFERFPFKVEVLSRFRTQAQQTEILKKLERGQIDLVIGTHRLLSKDVKFKDLGLLVVDEEQRFGVQDKETIKKIKTNVDVLTLSATPIPRTLNMSLTGIKDMSLIEEPPEERYPVQTYVLEQDDRLLKEVIEREIGRGGQVFVVFNRVNGITGVAEKIEKLVPEARVIVGHGRMNEHTLENVMLEFINHEADVLVATTIIESGLDIPNANTMVVMDTDRYGLSQLYQLRGRVGRSDRMAYAYFMYQKNKTLNEQAEKRLKAIREFTEFGAGFKIAMRDLEIRGAGNMLGTAQSGHIMNIGYELYCKMVDNAVRALQGEIVRDEKTETALEIPVSAYIPSYYIEDETLKLEMYKKISGVRSEEDEDDILDELTDRFGDVPRETVNLVKISHIRFLAEELGIERVRKVQQTDISKPASTGRPASSKGSRTGNGAVRPGMSNYGIRAAGGGIRPGMSNNGRLISSNAGISGPAGTGKALAVNNGRTVSQNNDREQLIFEFGKENSLSGFGIMNLNEKMGQKAFVHAGSEPYIRLTADRRKLLEDSIEMLEILYESRKTVV